MVDFQLLGDLQNIASKNYLGRRTSKRGLVIWIWWQIILAAFSFNENDSIQIN